VSPAPQKKHGAARTFVVGTLVGGVIAIAAPRLRRGLHPSEPSGEAGLRAFEGAPCWEYDRDIEQQGR
jgi:hypothetical protein